MPTGTYIKSGLKGVLLQQWWVILIALAIFSGYFFVASIWWFIGGIIGYGLYVLFWLIQFAGVTQMEQSKFLFGKLSYEITSQQVLMKLNEKQGMPIKWDQIKRVRIGKDHFILFLSKVQFIYLPFRIFNSDNEKKFLETILKRKEYIK